MTDSTHDKLSAAGKKGAEARNRDPETRRRAAEKAAQTRKADNPNAFREMGAQSHKNKGGRSE